MRRPIAFVLGLLLAAACGRVSALHVHAYAGHDHPEHHHGLAAHEHDRPAPPQDHDRGSRLESCDPGQHAVSLTMGCAPPPHVHVVDVACVGSRVVALVPLRSMHDVTDVRVHGPPRRSHASPRAPPLTVHA